MFTTSGYRTLVSGHALPPGDVTRRHIIMAVWMMSLRVLVVVLRRCMVMHRTELPQDTQ